MAQVVLPKPIKQNKREVVLSRKQYERLLESYRWQKDLDADLNEALEQVKRGELIGPFSSGKELISSLEK